MSDYYMWLLNRVGAYRGAFSSYRRLLDFLFSVKYEYAFEMDANRAAAGLNLRSIYALEAGLYLEDTHQGPCTVLEMLEALSDNLAFDTNESVTKWFWELITNLGLATQDDKRYDENYISAQIYKWMYHEYEANGKGSLFPLINPYADCRNMEVWDQKNAYLIENYPVGNWI